MQSANGVVSTIDFQGAGGPAPTPLRTVQPGVVDFLMVRLFLTIVSTGAAFNFVNSHGASAEGADDLDTLIDAVISKFTYALDESTFVITNEKLSQYRTDRLHLGLRDYTGALTTLAQVPASGSPTKYEIDIPIPLSLRERFPDGEIFAQGSKRVSRGTLTPESNPLPLNVVLSGGTCTVSAIAGKIQSYGRPGNSAQIGHSWQVTRLLGLPVPAELPEKVRIALFDESPVATNAVSDDGYMINANRDKIMQGPVTLGDMYDLEVTPLDGISPNGRCTPLDWLQRNAKVTTMPDATKIRVEGLGAAAFNLREIAIVSAPSVIASDIAAGVNGGGPVQVARPTPPSQESGSPVPPLAAPWLPVVPLAAAPRVAAPKMAIPKSKRVFNLFGVK